MKRFYDFNAVATNYNGCQSLGWAYELELVIGSMDVFIILHGINLIQI